MDTVHPSDQIRITLFSLRDPALVDLGAGSLLLREDAVGRPRCTKAAALSQRTPSPLENRDTQKSNAGIKYRPAGPQSTYLRPQPPFFRPDVR